MRPNLWLPADGVVLHARRDCLGISGATRVEAVSSTNRRVAMFDHCPRCVAGATHANGRGVVPPSSVLAPLRNRPASTVERMRTEARRRGVTFQEWAARVARLETMVDLNDAERVVDLTEAAQSASVIS